MSVVDAGHWIFLSLFLLAVIAIGVLGYLFHRRGLALRKIEAQATLMGLRVKGLEARLAAASMSDDALAEATVDPTKSVGDGPFRDPKPGEPTPFG